jgi:hypothetical protein
MHRFQRNVNSSLLLIFFWLLINISWPTCYSFRFYFQSHSSIASFFLFEQHNQRQHQNGKEQSEENIRLKEIFSIHEACFFTFMDLNCSTLSPLFLLEEATVASVGEGPSITLIMISGELNVL